MVVETLCFNQSFVTNLACNNFLTVNLIMNMKPIFASKAFSTKKVMIDLSKVRILQKSLHDSSKSKLCEVKDY